MLLPLGGFFVRLFVNVVLCRNKMLSIEKLKEISGCTRITPGAARASSSPRVPSSMSLPTELWVHAIEYASLDDAVDAKKVSRTLWRAARFALTRGRWAPVGKCVRAIKALPWRDWGFDKKAHITDEVKALFCAAWKVAEPRLLNELADSSWSSDMETTLGMLLTAAEPVISGDAHRRVVASLEHIKPFDAHFNWFVIDSWHKRAGERDDDDLHRQPQDRDMLRWRDYHRLLPPDYDY